MDYKILQRKVSRYEEIIQNSINYRDKWNTYLRDMIIESLDKIITETNLQADIEIFDKFSGLEGVALILGISHSGIAENIAENVDKPMVRFSGSLLFQQLFNGKVSIWINYPFIEGIGQPKSPRMVEIVRPHELKEASILSYVESFIDDVTAWEDFDDDKTPGQSIGFNHPRAKAKPLK
jgi:hypothetical protein